MEKLRAGDWASPQLARPSEWIGESAITDAGDTIDGIELWGPETTAAFQQVLLDWYDRTKRPLPWRETHDPYRIWVSEIMLQQTQSQTVKDYYQRFLERFPDVETLAAAPEAELLKVWEGLGYYSRARNMQAAARQILERPDHRFPTHYDDLLELKGIGPYTAGAIASIAFDEPVPAVDGNALRVFSRLFTITLDVSRAKTQRLYRKIIRTVIPAERPGAFNQAIMDLGASFENPNGDPTQSPVKDFNLATLTETSDYFPIKAKKKPPKHLHFTATIYETPDGQVLIEQRTEERLLHNLWTVPLEQTDAATTVAEDGTDYLGNVRHVFSHQIWDISVFRAPISVADATARAQRPHTALITPFDTQDYAFPTVQQKIWRLFDEYKKAAAP